MANSICLSSDMTQLMIIDENGNVTNQDELAGDGLIVSLDSTGNLQCAKASSPASGSTFSEPLASSQLTLTYHEPSQELYIIGVIDIDGTLRTAEQSFPLSTGNSAQISVDGGMLKMESIV